MVWQRAHSTFEARAVLGNQDLAATGAAPMAAAEDATFEVAGKGASSTNSISCPLRASPTAVKATKAIVAPTLRAHGWPAISITANRTKDMPLMIGTIVGIGRSLIVSLQSKT